MGWRSKGCGCGTGVGCEGTHPTPVCVVAGERLTFELVSSVGDVFDRLVRVEVRDRVGGRLLVDLGPFCSVSVVDGRAVVVDVPGEVTAAWGVSGVWDGWIGSERVGFGSFLVELGVSRGNGRVLTVSGWNPVLISGIDFVREIVVRGLLPLGEQLGSGPGVFRVSGVGGGVSDFSVSVSAADNVVRIALSVGDVLGLGLGRFLYSLFVVNNLGDERCVLAGVLTIVEAGGGGDDGS